MEFFQKVPLNFGFKFRIFLTNATSILLTPVPTRNRTPEGVAELVEDVFKWDNLSPLLSKEGLGVVKQ